MSDVIPIKKAKFDEYRKLFESINPKYVMVIAMGEDDHIKFIPPPGATSFEILVLLEMVKQKILTS